MNKHFVISFFGGVSKTAAAIGIKSSSVSEWPEEIPFSAIGRIAIYQPKALEAWRSKSKPSKAVKAVTQTA